MSLELVLWQKLKSYPKTAFTGLFGLVIVLDYLTGPQIRVPVLDTILVAVCAAFASLSFAVILALVLGVTGYFLHLFWGDVAQEGIALLLVNEGIDALMLLAVAYVVHRLTKAQEEVRILRGFLPICSNCKQIRGTDDKWYQLEEYITKHSEALFSHGICPDCHKIYKAELEKIAAEKERANG